MPDDPDEPFVIKTILNACGKPTSGQANRVGPPLLQAGDDAAMVSNSDAVTVDTMVEGIHWDDRLSAEDVGWKLVAANVSDINAMGGLPSWAVLSIALPSPLDRGWVTSFALGLAEAAHRWGVHLVGGDTTGSPGPRMVSLTLCGHVEVPIGRHGARPGDDLWVSGALGGAAAGFGMGAHANDALRRPSPPVGLGAALAATGGVSAMMDLSDGLRMDLHRLCAASGVGAEVVPGDLPAHPDAAACPDPIRMMTGFGEEYELLVTARPSSAAAIEAAASDFDRAPVRIGRINGQASHGAQLKGMAWPPLAFSHFGDA